MWDSAPTSSRERRKGQQSFQHSFPIHVRVVIMDQDQLGHKIMELEGGWLSAVVMALHLFFAFAGQERRWESPPQTHQLAWKWGEKPLRLLASSRTPQGGLQLPRDSQGKPSDFCPLNCSNLWVNKTSVMEKYSMSRDLGICTGKDLEGCVSAQLESNKGSRVFHELCPSN